MRKGSVRITPDEAKDIFARLAAGEPQKDVAERYRVTTQRIYRLKVEYGIPTFRVLPLTAFPDEHWEPVLADIKAGMRVREAAAKHKHNPDTIYKIMRRKGILPKRHDLEERKLALRETLAEARAAGARSYAQMANWFNANDVPVLERASKWWPASVLAVEHFIYLHDFNKRLKK
jgi:Mor family transcriptional regulator